MKYGWNPEKNEYLKKERRLSLEQLVEMAEGHRAREDELIQNASKTFFIDTDATITFSSPCTTTGKFISIWHSRFRYNQPL